jgi:arylsulfatase A-like enzyme
MGRRFEVMQKGTTAKLDSNAPFRGQKRQLWEGGVRVPGIVRWPGRVPAGATSHEIVHMCDVMPSVLAAAGVAVDEKWKLDGSERAGCLARQGEIARSIAVLGVG